MKTFVDRTHEKLEHQDIPDQGPVGRRIRTRTSRISLEGAGGLAAAVGSVAKDHRDRELPLAQRLTSRATTVQTW